LQTIDTIIQWSFSLDAPADLTRLASRRMAEVSPGVLYNDFLACNAFDLTARLAEIRCPTLVICGAQDKMTPPNQAQYLAAQIPVSRLEVVPHAGHMVMLEQPFTVAEILTRFLSEIG
jgi:pimeloyl-ACP methyl ester carboxylesterase